MSQPRSHRLDVYDCWLHVATNRRQLATLRRKYGKTRVPPVEPGEFGCTTRFRDQPANDLALNHYVIFVNTDAHRGNQGALLNTVAHEATHAGGLILDSTNTEYDGNSEPLAWLVAWITQWVWEATT